MNLQRLADLGSEKSNLRIHILKAKEKYINSLNKLIKSRSINQSINYWIIK